TGELAQQMTGDEEAGDREEDVDADVAPRQTSGPEVVEDDKHDGDRPQPLDLLADDRRGGICAGPVRARRGLLVRRDRAHAASFVGPRPRAAIAAARPSIADVAASTKRASDAPGLVSPR